jgi:hypothetical protein
MLPILIGTPLFFLSEQTLDCLKSDPGSILHGLFLHILCLWPISLQNDEVSYLFVPVTELSRIQSREVNGQKMTMERCEQWCHGIYLANSGWLWPYQASPGRLQHRVDHCPM